MKNGLTMKNAKEIQRMKDDFEEEIEEVEGKELTKAIEQIKKSYGEINSDIDAELLRQKIVYIKSFFNAPDSETFDYMKECFVGEDKVLTKEEFENIFKEKELKEDLIENPERIYEFSENKVNTGEIYMNNKLRQELIKIYETNEYGNYFTQYDCEDQKLYHIRSLNGGLEGVLNEEGNWIIEPKVGQVYITSKSIFSEEGYPRRWKLLTLSGKKIIRKTFKNILLDNYKDVKTVFVEHTNGKWSLIDINGNYIFEDEWSCVSTIRTFKNIIRVSKNRRDGLINFQGEYILEPIYKYMSIQNEIYVEDGIPLKLIIGKEKDREKITIEDNAIPNSNISTSIEFCDIYYDIDFEKIKKEFIDNINNDSNIRKSVKEFWNEDGFLDSIVDLYTMADSITKFTKNKNIIRAFTKALHENNAMTSKIVEIILDNIDKSDLI